MQITYLDNSGFYIDTSDVTLVFDYYNTHTKGAAGLDGGVVLPADISKNKKAYVFVTHSHADHYNPCVLNWQKQNADITYIFDNEIKAGEHVVTMQAGERFADETISVKAFGSTDIGISFLVTVAGKTIFHAGDLNFWHWDEEADEAFIKKADKDFSVQLDALTAADSVIDVMFFPCDYRMGKNGADGAVRAMDALKPALLVPMHFQNRFDKIEAFKNQYQNKDTSIWGIARRGATLHVV